VTLFIGVDGGGTRTRAVIVDDDGREVGRASGAGAVATASQPELAAAAVIRAVQEAAATSGVRLPASVLWAGLAGAGTPAARDGVRTALEQEGVADRVVVGTDVEAAFQHAFGDRSGVLLIAGTGSIAWIRDEAGEVRRVGGWGRHVGDEGSGFAMGLDALRLVTRAADGRAEPTSLATRVLEQCALSSLEEVVPWIETAKKGEVAALAPLVVAEADGGDPGAAALVGAAVDGLVAHVRAACGETKPTVVLWGGLVADGGPLRSRVLEALAQEGFSATSRPLDPGLGAAMLAREAGRT
jgi:glucosamine kinase